MSGQLIPRGADFGGGYSTPQIAGAGGSGPSYDEKVAAAKNLTAHDPARVAQVVKKWVAAND